MSAPRRIQRLRKKGWRKPPAAVNVTRPSKWANPYKLADYDDPAECLSDYGAHLDRELAAGRLDVAEIRGKDLMCWCSPGTPCHADILLKAANAPETEASVRHRKLEPVGRGPGGRPVYRREDVIDEARRLSSGPALSVLDEVSKR